MNPLNTKDLKKIFNVIKNKPFQTIVCVIICSIIAHLYKEFWPLEIGLFLLFMNMYFNEASLELDNQKRQQTMEPKHY